MNNKLLLTFTIIPHILHFIYYLNIVQTASENKTESQIGNKIIEFIERNKNHFDFIIFLHDQAMSV